MNTKSIPLTIALLATSPVALLVHAQPTAITYQGSLSENGVPAAGLYDFQFKVFNQGSAGSQISSTLTKGDQPVSNGLFTVSLDFGANVFTGSDRWLEISVRPGASTDPHTNLTPRQKITSVPYAVRAANYSGPVDASQLNGDVPTTVLGNAWKLGGNAGTVPGAQYLGTLDNTPLEIRVNNVQAVRFEPNATSPNIVGGYATNLVAPGTVGAVIGGGGAHGRDNRVAGDYGTVPGGSGNFAGAEHTFAAGHFANAIHQGAFVWADSQEALFSSTAPDQFLVRAAGGMAVGTNDPAGAALHVAGEVRAGAFSGNWQTISTSMEAVPNRCYLANSGNRVTVTLPASGFRVGDVVRVAGAGTGGWAVAMADARLSIRTLNLRAFGSSWNEGGPLGDWRSIAASSDGTRLFAVGYGSFTFSTNSGASWTNENSAGAQYTGIACSADGRRLLLAERGDRLRTSGDFGATWTQRDSSRPWAGVAASANGINMVAAEFPGRIYTSSDAGVNWRTNGPTRPWTGIASSADGTKLVAVESDPGNFLGMLWEDLGQIHTSSDSGQTWTARETPRYWSSVASSADGTKLVAVVYGGRIYTSSDSGVTWTPRESNRLWKSVASSADGSKHIAAVSGGQVYVSTDSGRSWVAQEYSRDWGAVACSGDGTKMAVGGDSTFLHTTSAATTSGPNGGLTGDMDSAIELQHVGSGRFRVLSYAGAIDVY